MAPPFAPRFSPSPRQRTARRGFASALTNALVVLALLSLIALVYAHAALQRASLARLGTTVASDHFEDAQGAYRAAVGEAMFDAAYTQCGCGGSAPAKVGSNFTARIPPYFDAVTQALNASSDTNYSNLAVASFVMGSCNATVTGGANYTLTVRAPSATLSSDVEARVQGDFTQTPTYFSATLTDLATSQSRTIAVSCP